MAENTEYKNSKVEFEKLDQTGAKFSLTDMVKFKVAYAKDYSGKKHLKDGKEISIHRLHADRLVHKGVGKIV